VKGGYLYIVTNDAFPGFVKVGCTEDLDARLRSYQTSDPKRGYKMVFNIPHPDCLLAEKRIGEAMRHFALSQRNEWYEIPLHMAVSRLEEEVENYDNGPV
jgi:hypothetical protein